MASTSSPTTAIEGSRRLFIGNLPPFARYKDLLKAFLGDGAQSAHVIKHGKMRIGFVTFKTSDVANSALSRVSREGLNLYKRQLVVKKADPWHDRKVAKVATPVIVDNNITPDFSKPALDLPAEVIARIVTYLSYPDRARAECVSRTWREGSLMSHGGVTQLTTGGPLWELDWGRSLITTEGFYWAIQRIGPTLKTLVLREDNCEPNLRPCILTIAAKACRDLEHVDLAAITCRPSGLRELGECTSQLRTLIMGRSWGAVDEELRRLLERNQGLQELQLRNSGVKGRGLEFLTPHLKILVVDRCPRLEADHLARYLELTEKLQSLTILNGRSLRGGSILQALKTNRALRDQLQHLIIHATDFRQMTEAEDLEEMETEEGDRDEQNILLDPDFEQAQFLELGDLEHEVSPELPANLIAVQELSLTALAWVDSLFVWEMATHMVRVESLNLSFCSNIRGTEALDPLSRLENLRRLRINHLHPSVSGNFLGTLSGLEVLEARGSQGMETESICELLRVAPDLQCLDLENCR